MYKRTTFLYNECDLYFQSKMSEWQQELPTTACEVVVSKSTVT